MNRNVIAVLPPTAASMPILVACQTNDASENEETETQVPESKSEPQSVKVAYQFQQEFPMTIQVTSTSIKHTGYLKKNFTCEGGNLSPQLTFIDVPSETKNLAVVVDDIDAEEGALAHWLLWGVPPDVTKLEGGISGSGNLPGDALEGTNGYGGTGWKGPCPPPRIIYNTRTSKAWSASENTGITSPVYQINVYALDTEILASVGADREEVLRKIDGHVIAGGFVLTRYLSSIVIRE